MRQFFYLYYEIRIQSRLSLSLSNIIIAFDSIYGVRRFCTSLLTAQHKFKLDKSSHNIIHTHTKSIFDEDVIIQIPSNLTVRERLSPFQRNFTSVSVFPRNKPENMFDFQFELKQFFVQCFV